MADPSVTGSWLSKAGEDLNFAKASLKGNLDFYPQICFHLHQAAEKYLKAYIVANNLNFVRIHDLTQLLKICSGHEPDFARFADSMSELNPFYIETRYPDVSAVSTTKKKTVECLKRVEELASFVKSKIGLVTSGG